MKFTTLQLKKLIESTVRTTVRKSLKEGPRFTPEPDHTTESMVAEAKAAIQRHDLKALMQVANSVGYMSGDIDSEKWLQVVSSLLHRELESAMNEGAMDV